MHKNITEKLDEKLAVKAQNREMSVFSLDSAADRLFLVGLLVHAADLSGQGMCRETAYFFGRGVLREFHAQYDEECAQGLPLSTFMQGLETHLGQAKAQLGFLSFVVAPMWRQDSTAAPQHPSVSPAVLRFAAQPVLQEVKRVTQMRALSRSLHWRSTRSTRWQSESRNACTRSTSIISRIGAPRVPPHCMAANLKCLAQIYTIPGRIYADRGSPGACVQGR